VEPDLISQIKEAQKEDSEIWTIVKNLNEQTEFRLDEDNVLWQGLQKAWGTRLKFSTAFHPQTDGETESTIQTLEDMLRSCALEWTGN
nr:putative reverse transcriptase domain-containing protein [Tanacetum cinerariifolium]